MFLRSATALALLHLVAALAVRVNEGGAAGDVTVTVFNTRWVDATRPITTTPASPTSINKAAPVQTPVKTPAAGGAEPTLITAPDSQTGVGDDTSDSTSDDTSDISTPTPDQSIPAVATSTPSVTPSSNLSPLATPVAAGATTPSKAATTPVATTPSSTATANAGTAPGAASGASDTGSSAAAANFDAPIALTVENPPLMYVYPAAGVTINNCEEYDPATRKISASAELKNPGVHYDLKKQLGLGQWPTDTAKYEWHMTYTDSLAQKFNSTCTAERRAGGLAQKADVFLSFTAGERNIISAWVLAPIGEIDVKCDKSSRAMQPRPSPSPAATTSTSTSASAATATTITPSTPLFNVYLGDKVTITNFKAYDVVSKKNLEVGPFTASRDFTHKAQMGFNGTGQGQSYTWETTYEQDSKTVNTNCAVALHSAEIAQTANLDLFLFYHWPTRSFGSTAVYNSRAILLSCTEAARTILPAVYLVLGPGVNVKNFVGYDSTTGESGSHMPYNETTTGGTYIKAQLGLGFLGEGIKAPPPIVWEIEYTVGAAVGVVGTVTTEICTVNRRVSTLPQKADAIFVIQAVAGDGHVPVTVDSAKELTFSCKANTS